VVVFETRNLARAAGILGISRSAVRQNIRELGNQLGVTLFIPHQKGVMPTSDAGQLYPNIKKAVDLIIEAENSVNAFTADSPGLIKMAMSNTAVIMLIRDYMAEFCAAYPKVTFEFFSLESRPLLERGEIDFILDDDLFFMGSSLDTINLFTANPVLIAAKEFLRRHNLGETITSDDLARLPVIALRPSPYDIGVHTSPYIKTVSLDMTYQMVKALLGVGHFCRELLDSLADPDIVAVNITNVPLQKLNVVVGYKNLASREPCSASLRNTTLSKPARAFIEGLQKFCKRRYEN